MSEGVAATVQHHSGAASATVRDGPYAWYVLFVLTVCYTLAYVDKQIIALLVGPIKQHFGLSDTAISMLIGIAFTGSYVLMGLAFGRWVDRGNRRNILMMGGVLWTGGAMATGVSPSYAAMFVSRIWVGGAEAAMYPSGMSMIADYFSPRLLARAVSIFLLAAYIGGGMSLIFGGATIGYFQSLGEITLPVVGPMQPWQMVVVSVALIGLVPILLLMTVAEPARQHGDMSPLAQGAASGEKLSFSEGLRFIRRKRSFYYAFYVGISLELMTLYSLPAWAPSFLIRHFELPASRIGLQFGSVMLVAGSLGTLLAPYFAVLLGKRGHPAAHMRGTAFIVAAMVPCAIAVPLVSTYAVALGALGGLVFLSAAATSLGTTSLQLFSPNRLRGLANAIYLGVATIIGQALSPTLVALCTDYVFRDPGKVGWSIGLVCSIASVGGAILLALGARGFREHEVGQTV